MATLNPPAALEPHETDVPVDFNRPLRFSLFAEMKMEGFIEKNPNALAVRRFQAGDEVCRLGDMGWTAFYTLTTEEALELLREVLSTADEEKKEQLQAEIAALESRKSQLEACSSEQEKEKLETTFTVYLPGSQPVEVKPTGAFAWIAGLFHRQASVQPVATMSRTDEMGEGELFGESACIYGRPRAATITANRPCYVLEMLRNVLDQLQKNKTFKENIKKCYEKRVLSKHLRYLSIFNKLPDSEVEPLIQKLRPHVKLVPFQDGQLICDEHDRSDAVYLIRRGLVRVVKNASSLLTIPDVVSWSKLAAAFADDPKTSEAGRALRKLLPAEVLSALAGVGSGSLPDAEQPKVLQALNDCFVKKLQPSTIPCLQSIVSGESIRQFADLATGGLNCPELEQRRTNRLLLEAVCAGAVKPRLRQVGSQSILAYRSEGEFIGEMGVLHDQPRSATCVAYVHPPPQGGIVDASWDRWRKGPERVELVYIPEQAFRDLMVSSKPIHQELEKVAKEREEHTKERLSLPSWSTPAEVLQSEEFQKQGLIQGQKLMLIDLDRCTRCDECVQACVNTHADKRSRLFLDGSRFGNYLVPTTCRSCLDPVCTIDCPVAAIHRGNSLQIVIENNCIGCGMCAAHCPYGSIQMHDNGLIAIATHGWRYYPAGAVTGDGWVRNRFRDGRWLAGQSPFRGDDDFTTSLKNVLEAASGDSRICFRYRFRVSRGVLESAAGFTLQLTTTEKEATVWLNGKEVAPEGPPKRGKRTYSIPLDGTITSGENVVAVRVTPTGAVREPLLQLRLDADPRPLLLPGKKVADPVKTVEERAVVCDQCNGLPPACVMACPHDAARRIDARFDFPVGKKQLRP